MDPVEASLVIVLAGLAAFTQSLSGFGFSLFIVPPLALVVGPKDAVVLANALGTAVNLAMIARAHAHIEWRLGFTLLAGAAAGMPLGLFVLVVIDPTPLQVVIAVTVLVSTVLVWRGATLHGAGKLGDVAVGVVSGILNTSTSMSGPPVVLYLQGRGVAPESFRATLAAFFCASSLIAVVLFSVGGRFTSDIVLLAFASLPALGIGWVAGNRVYGRLDPAQFRRVVIGVLLASGVLALVTAFVR